MPEALDEEKRRSQVIKQFGEDWELRSATREIARKNRVWYGSIWPRQHQVKTRYVWIKSNWSQFANSNLPFPMDHDNVPRSAGQPVQYALLGGWTIPKRDQIYLTDGPLYDEHWELLVPVEVEGWPAFLKRRWKTLFGIFVVSGTAAGIYWILNI